MTKVYELPNGHRMVADIDESTRVCNITETTLDSLVSKLNYYAEQTDVLDKIRAEIDNQYKWLLKAGYTAYNVDIAFGAVKAALRNEVSE